MRVFTCTPVRFKGDHTFFSRDSGLLSIGLEMIGVESRAIMPGPPMDDDDPRLLRTNFHDLASADWWRSLNLDGLVFYSWASPQYNHISLAIRDAGIPFIVNMDTNGLVSPLANLEDWLREIHVSTLGMGVGVLSKLKLATKEIIELLCNRVTRQRIKHYEHASAVAVVTPHAALWVPREAGKLGKSGLAAKFNYLPHAQLPEFNYNGRAKSNLVMTVGRWHPEDWPQKNPGILLDAYCRFLSEKPQWSGLIVGPGAPQLAKRIGFNTSAIGNRLHFMDYVKADHLPDYYQNASIGLWTSRWEGQQGTAAQALCCGCSVVGPSSALNNCFRHYVSRESGRLAARNSAQAFADELIIEANSWESGARDPERISQIWCKEFHADQVALKCLSMLGLNPM